MKKETAKFFLEIPSIERKNEILEYLDEFVKYESDVNGLGPLTEILQGYSFEKALKDCLNVKYKQYAQKLGRSQSKTFLLIRENDNKLIGSINVRWNLSKERLQFGGHIGYGIRPTERRKGYNKINLYLGLIEAKKLHLTNVMLDCDVNNLASNKTIISLGGKLVSTEIDPYDNLLTNVYWIAVDESLAKYKDVYCQVIINPFSL